MTTTTITPVAPAHLPGVGKFVPGDRVDVDEDVAASLVRQGTWRRPAPSKAAKSGDTKKETD